MRFKNHSLKLLLSGIFFITLWLLAIPVIAAVSDPIIFDPQVGIPGFMDNVSMEENNTSYIARMVTAFYDYGLGIGGILAAIMLMAGGVVWLTSAGSSEKVGQAKNLIGGSLAGLVLLFGAWIMLQTINPYLLNFRISDIKGVVAIYLGDGADGFIDGMASLPTDATIKYKCLGVEQLCVDTIPPSTQLDISLCAENKSEPVTCSGNTPDKNCCAISDTITQELNKECADKSNGTPCKVSATDAWLSGFCFDKKCNGGTVCCQCYNGYIPLTGLYLNKNCKNDLSKKECIAYCENGTGWASDYYPGGSTNYTCAGGALSSCKKK